MRWTIFVRSRKWSGAGGGEAMPRRPTQVRDFRKRLSIKALDHFREVTKMVGRGAKEVKTEPPSGTRVQGG